MNLTRVNDILKELEKQLGPLEKQSETAREYLKKKEELKTFDINMFLLEEERLRERIRETQEKYDIAAADMDESSERHETMKAEYEAIEEEVEDIDRAIEVAVLETTLVTQRQVRGGGNIISQLSHGEVAHAGEHQDDSRQERDDGFHRRRSSLGGGRGLRGRGLDMAGGARGVRGSHGTSLGELAAKT